MRSRRLVGPTITSLALCGLLADYLVFAETRWSVTRFLGVLVSNLASVLTVPYDAGAYTWMRDFWFPLSLGLLALMLLRLMIRGAKRAMRKASDTTAHPLNDTAHESIDTTPMLEQRSTTKPISELPSFHLKLLGIPIMVVVLFGSTACVIVYTSLESAVKQHVQDRAGIMALGLRDLVRAALVAGKTDDVSAALASYAAREKIAYLYVENNEGRMIAHWPADLPRYLRRDFPYSSARAVTGTIVNYRAMTLYAVAKRSQEERPGFIHVAVEQDSSYEVARDVVVSLAMTIAALVVLSGISLFVWSAGAIQRPWSELVKHASRISKGDFTRALPLERQDEFGDIARSLERLRSSLHATAKRLA